MKDWKTNMMAYKRSPLSLILRILVIAAACITMFILCAIIIYILVKGIPNLNLKMFAWHYTSDNVSMTSAIINTVLMVLLTLVFATPIGIFSAIYLVEYAKRGNKIVLLIRMTTETLAGIPSIVYGLFGFLMFAVAFKWGYSFLGGALTLAMMVLPTIMRTTEEALKAVPDSYREGSFGLGAGRLRTVFQVVLPSAIPGILSGVILSIGRIVGETAALIFTAGTIAEIPGGLLQSGRTLAIHMYALLNEGLHVNEAYATAVVLLALVIVINAVSERVAHKLSQKTGA